MTKNEFAEMVLESTDSLYRVSKGILKNDSDCEDAVWEAVSIGFAKLPALRQKQYAKTWLIRILIHECYRILREKKRSADTDTDRLESSAVFAGQTDERPDYSELYESLFRLEEKYRIPLVLFYLEGYSVREIAGILETPEGTVKSQLSRGRNRLREIMMADHPEESGRKERLSRC